INITTVQELRAVKLRDLKHITGNSSGEFLFNIVRGVDPGIYSGKIKKPSVSNEITFEEDTENSELIKLTILELAHKIFFRILESGEKGRTVQLKLRFTDFTTVTIRETLEYSVNSGEELYKLAVKLLEKKWDGLTAVRLIGLGLSSLESNKTPDQIELFPNTYDQARKVEQVVLDIKKRGSKLTKASLLKHTRDDS
ncbi:MAG: DNA polymerase IV, partial [Spirochaetales bacterium]|nr:DNA polymerase IV [Spirochaetales bacterium]